AAHHRRAFQEREGAPTCGRGRGRRRRDQGRLTRTPKAAFLEIDARHIACRAFSFVRLVRPGLLMLIQGRVRRPHATRPSVRFVSSYRLAYGRARSALRASSIDINPDGLMGGNSTRLRVGVAFASMLLLTACGQQNKYQPPPPAEVTVAKPVQRKVTLYMEVTGSTAPINRVDLVARVQGFLDKVAYKDGAAVKKGDLLFQIDPEDYKIALQIAEATQQQQEALLLQADNDLKRKQDLVKTSAVSVAQVDESRAKRDSTLAAL